jgi:steroid 5-alpha reductase family enzyme
VWWGLWGLACSQWVGLLSLPSPVLMTYLLVRRTGKALLEKRMRRSKGDAYRSMLLAPAGSFPDCRRS